MAWCFGLSVLDTFCYIKQKGFTYYIIVALYRISGYFMLGSQLSVMQVFYDFVIGKHVCDYN